MVLLEWFTIRFDIVVIVSTVYSVTINRTGAMAYSVRALKPVRMESARFITINSFHYFYVISLHFDNKTASRDFFTIGKFVKSNIASRSGYIYFRKIQYF